MQRVWVLNWNNISYDKDFTAWLLATIQWGIVTGFAISWSGASAEIEPWKALIKCERTNWEEILVFFESTENVAVDMSGTKKVYIEIDQTKIDDWSSNNEDGTGIWAITTDPSAYPTKNFVALYDVVSWVATDDRVGIYTKLLRKELIANKLLFINSNWEETYINLSSNVWDALLSNWPTWVPYWENITQDLSSSFVLWEDMEQWDYVAYVPDVTNTIASFSSWNSDARDFTATYIYNWQVVVNSWTKKITDIKFQLKNNWNPLTWNAYAQIYDWISWTPWSSGIPSWSITATSEAYDVSNLTSWYQEITFHFTNPVEITDNFAIVLYYTWWSTSDRLIVYSSNSGWDSWNAFTWTSWPSWNALSSYDLVYTVEENISAGYYLTDATDTNKINSVWFITQSWNQWETKTLKFWLNTYVSWKTPWATQYLSDTPWKTSEIAWTNSVKIWKAITDSDVFTVFIL